MADKKIHLKIVSPNRIVLEKDVDMVIARSVEGDLGILPGHEQLTTLLGYGALKYIIGNEEQELSVLGGFAEITAKSIIILTDAAELPSEIDTQRAEEAKKRAQERIASSKSNTNLVRAENSLHRALIRLDVADNKSKKFN
ncbi:MAG: ATP synthase F1 subunit epsilon [Lachnospirales bacterium]